MAPDDFKNLGLIFAAQEDQGKNNGASTGANDNAGSSS